MSTSNQTYLCWLCTWWHLLQGYRKAEPPPLNKQSMLVQLSPTKQEKLRRKRRGVISESLQEWQYSDVQSKNIWCSKINIYVSATLYHMLLQIHIGPFLNICLSLKGNCNLPQEWEQVDEKVINARQWLFKSSAWVLGGWRWLCG